MNNALPAYYGIPIFTVLEGEACSMCSAVLLLDSTQPRDFNPCRAWDEALAAVVRRAVRLWLCPRHTVAVHDYINAGVPLL